MKKILAIVLSLVLLCALVLMALGKIAQLQFWMTAGVIALISWIWFRN